MKKANSVFCGVLFAALLCFVGVGAIIYNIQASVANFEYVLNFVSIGLVVMIPVLTMRSFSEERKQKTDQLLYSLPLKTWQIVGGKYLSLVAMFLLPMAIICVYPYLFSKYGEVYLPGAYGALFAFFVMSAALIAVGMFISSLTDNQGFAAGIAIVLFLFNYYSVSLAAGFLHRLWQCLCSVHHRSADRRCCKNTDQKLRDCTGGRRRTHGADLGGLLHRAGQIRGTASEHHGKALAVRPLHHLCQRCF